MILPRKIAKKGNTKNIKNIKGLRCVFEDDVVMCMFRLSRYGCLD